MVWEASFTVRSDSREGNPWEVISECQNVNPYIPSQTPEEDRNGHLQSTLTAHLMFGLVSDLVIWKLKYNFMYDAERSY